MEYAGLFIYLLNCLSVEYAGFVLSKWFVKEWIVLSHMYGLVIVEWFGHGWTRVSGFVWYEWFFRGKRFGHEWTVWCRVNGLVMGWSRMNGLVTGKWLVTSERFGHRLTVTGEQLGYGRTVCSRVDNLVKSKRFGLGWTVWVDSLVSGKRFVHGWMI